MASRLDLYPNLPGILTEFEDGGLALREEQNPPATDSILLLGTATDGPVMEPVAVDANTYTLFGTGVGPNNLPDGSTLPFAFEEAYAEGCRDIRMMRISGKVASLELKAPAKTFSEYVTAVEPLLGSVAGNIEVTFTLPEHPDDVEAVLVRANGAEVEPTKYSVNPGDDSTPTTVTLQADAVDAGSLIEIVYLVNGEQVVRNGNGTEAWVAPGEEQVFTLEHKPEILYAAPLLLAGESTPVDDTKYTISANKLTLHADHGLPMGTKLTLRYVYLSQKTVQPTLRLESYFGGSKYNDGSAKVEWRAGNQRAILITKPPSKRPSDEAPREYTSIDYPTLGLLAQAINSDPNNGIYRAIVEDEFADEPTASLFVTPEPVPFTGGDDELNLSKEELYERLHQAYTLLENYRVDYIVPLGVYADDVLIDPNKNFADQLALACAFISYREGTVQGVIATSSPKSVSLEAIKNHVDKLLAYPNRHVMKDTLGNELKDEEGKPYDIGRFIYVLAGPDRNFYNPRIGTYSANSAAAFAGRLSILPPNSSALNKEVTNDRGLRFNYSNSQRNALIGNRYVVYKLKGQGTSQEVTAIEDEPTAALPGSDYAMGSTTRQVKFAVNRIRQVVEPFLGEAPNVSNQNALNTAIDKVLNDELIGNGILMPGSTFQLEASLFQRTLGESTLRLSLVPSIVRRRINVVVQLTPGT